MTAFPARDWILDQIEPLDAIELPLSSVAGMVLATDARALDAMPAFDTSAMDGFAVRPDPRSPTTVVTIGRSRAGAEFVGELGEGEALRIMTGARVPGGAVAVIPFEDAVDRDGLVTIPDIIPAGANIRPRAEDHQAGDVLVRSGTQLSAAHIAVLASIGHDHPSVVRRPRVGVLSTGDELAGSRSGRSSIRDVNRPGLLALIEASGATPIDLGSVGDDEPALSARLDRAVSDCDALLTSGGVSVGDHDLVKHVLTRAAQTSCGVSRWMRVAVRPAKPLMFATVRGKPVLGLPGNPASAFVSFGLFALPVLDRLAGHREARTRRMFTATAASEFRREPDGRLHVEPVIARLVDGVVSITSAATRGRHHVAGTSSANAYAYLADGPSIPAGSAVRCGWIPGTRIA